MMRKIRASLDERIKELTCLYGIAQIVAQPGAPIGAMLRKIVALLPPAWQYPGLAVARIRIDRNQYSTGDMESCPHRQRAELTVKGKPRGLVEVGYVRETPACDEGPFLKEERHLLDAVARQIVFLIERREALREKARLEAQLRHADRLATIGQLSAGVAHELNEPLGHILAFAQLAKKTPALPPSAARDLAKIETTALHAREVVKKLMLFARQMPPRASRVNLNAVVEEVLHLLEARFESAGVSARRELASDVPEILADPSQLVQALVNLAVNAIQALPHGGVVTFATSRAGEQVLLSVEDNGVGMSRKTLKKIFLPFFTTKDVHEGTGLGLSVVHGIVTAHGGTIDATSSPGRGARFEIRLPLPPSVDSKKRNRA